MFLSSLEQLRKTPLTGKIAVLQDDLASEPLMPKSFHFWNPEEHKEIISLLEQGGTLAVLTSFLASPSDYLCAFNIEGDHTLFSISGVPAVAVTSAGIFELAEQVLHTAEDKPELIELSIMADLVDFLLSFLKQNLNSSS